jgi:hypothetical protein
MINPDPAAEVNKWELEAQVNKWVAHPDQYYAAVDNQRNLKIGSLGIFTGSKKVKLENSSGIIASTLLEKKLYFDRLITKFEKELMEKRGKGKVIEGSEWVSMQKYVKEGRLKPIMDSINGGSFELAYALFSQLTQEFQAEFMKSNSELVSLLKKKLFGDPPHKDGFACKDSDIALLSKFFLSQAPVPDPTTRKNLPQILSQVLSGNFSAKEKAYFLLPFCEQKPEGIYRVEMGKCLNELLLDQTVSSQDKANVLMCVGSKNLHVVELACATGQIEKEIDTSLHEARSEGLFLDEIKYWVMHAVNNTYKKIFGLLVKNFSEKMFDKEFNNDRGLISHLEYAINKNDIFLDIILKNMPREFLGRILTEHLLGPNRSTDDNKKKLCDRITEDYLQECMELEHVKPKDNKEYLDLLNELKLVNMEEFAGTPAERYILNSLKKYVIDRCKYYINRKSNQMGNKDLQTSVENSINALKDPNAVITFFHNQLETFNKPATNVSRQRRNAMP